MNRFKQLLLESLEVPVKKVRPTKTVKAYKLFNMKGGKLYPLYVFAKKPLPMKQWIEAEEGEKDANGKVKSGIGGLAYRPGYHACEFPIALHIGGKTSASLKKPNYRKDNQVWAEVEFDASVDYSKEIEASKKKCITDRVPVNGVYYFQTNPNAVCRWLIGGTMRINKILSDEEVKQINGKVGLADLPRLSELEAEQTEDQE